jgi:hypothetical protein
MMDYVSMSLEIIMAIVLLTAICMNLIGLPGNVIILIASIMYGWHEDFTHLTDTTLVVLTAAWFGAELFEFIAGMTGAKKENASWCSTMAAFIGATVGGIAGTGLMLVVGTIIGAIIGGFVTSYYIEYLQTGDLAKAQRVARGVVKGQIIGVIVKFVVGIGMTALIIYKLWL